MIQIKTGTIEWMSVPDGTAAPGFVLFSGVFLYEADGITPAMVWDATLQNVRPMVQADRDARTAANLLQTYAQTKASMTADAPSDKRWKALVLVLLDELNLIRSKLSPPLPARTIAQLRTAIGNKIDAGQADG